jgi:hypothetical protein
VLKKASWFCSRASATWPRCTGAKWLEGSKGKYCACKTWRSTSLSYGYAKNRHRHTPAPVLNRTNPNSGRASRCRLRTVRYKDVQSLFARSECGMNLLSLEARSKVFLRARRKPAGPGREALHAGELIHRPAETQHFPLDVASYKLYYVNEEIGPKSAPVDILCESCPSASAIFPLRLAVSSFSDVGVRTG